MMNFIENDACILYNEGPVKFTTEKFEELWCLRPDTAQQVNIYGRSG